MVRQPDERYICKSFAEKVKRTPAVGSGETRKGSAGGIGAWRSLPFEGNLELRFCCWELAFVVCLAPPTSFLLTTISFKCS